MYIMKVPILLIVWPESPMRILNNFQRWILTQYHFVYQKALIPTFGTSFSTTKLNLCIHNTHIQNPKVICGKKRLYRFLL